MKLCMVGAALALLLTACPEDEADPTPVDGTIDATTETSNDGVSGDAADTVEDATAEVSPETVDDASPPDVSPPDVSPDTPATDVAPDGTDDTAITDTDDDTAVTDTTDDAADGTTAGDGGGDSADGTTAGDGSGGDTTPSDTSGDAAVGDATDAGGDAAVGDAANDASDGTATGDAAGDGSTGGDTSGGDTGVTDSGADTTTSDAAADSGADAAPDAAPDAASDAASDIAADTAGDVPPPACVVDGDCDDSDPCTADTCNAGTCDNSFSCADAACTDPLCTAATGDTCAVAEPLAEGTTSGDSTTNTNAFDTGTALQCGPLGPGAGTQAPDVVYEFTNTGGAAQQYEATLDPSGWDALLTRNDACETDLCDAGVDAAGPDGAETLVFTLGGGDSVFLVVDGVAATDSGPFTLTIVPTGGCSAPVGTTLGSVEVGGLATASDDFAVVGSVCTDANFTDAPGLNGGDVVYEISVPDAQDVTIDADLAGGFEGVIAVLSDCGDTTSCVAATDTTVASSVTFAAAADTTYYIVIDAQAGAPSTDYDLQISGVEAACNDGADNDGDFDVDCADADCAGSAFCSCTGDGDCDDGNACTTDTCDGATGECSYAPLDCGDGDACTQDVCDPASGCSNPAIGNCPATLPYTNGFDCGDTDFELVAVSGTGVFWGVDALPDPPAYFSADCSLNYNTDKLNYASETGGPSEGTATSLPIDATGATEVWLSFYDFFNLADGPGSTFTGFDLMTLEVSDDGFQTFTVVDLGHQGFQESLWIFRAFDLSAFAGTSFQLRFRFDSVDDLANAGAGWFIDDLQVSDSQPVGPGPEVCGDGTDNDFDGAVDCADADCLADPLCPCTTDADCDDSNACTTDTCGAGSACTNAPIDCDDAVGCTVDSCDPGSGCVNTPDDGLCDDGVGCTVDSCDAVNDCDNAPDDGVCNDGDPCTSDTCDAANDCSSTAIPGCSASSLPYTNLFLCGDTDFTLVSNATDGTAWAVDALPDPPGFFSADCSLNYNDDAGAYGAEATDGTATSPVFDAGPLGGLWLSYVDYFEVEDAIASIYDVMEIRVSTDGFTTFDVIANPQQEVEEATWTYRLLDLSAYAGGFVQVQFVFDTVDDLANDGAGWFIDDFQLTEAPPAEVCDDTFDNDGNGDADCSDAACAGTPPCP